MISWFIAFRYSNSISVFRLEIFNSRISSRQGNHKDMYFQRSQCFENISFIQISALNVHFTRIACPSLNYHLRQGPWLWPVWKQVRQWWTTERAMANHVIHSKKSGLLTVQAWQHYTIAVWPRKNHWIMNFYLFLWNLRALLVLIGFTSFLVS